MRGFPLLLLVFLLVPVVEIYLLVQIGGVIGAGWTVFLVVLTAVIGAALVRHQGVATVNRLRAALDRGEVPALELLEGALILFAGALLLTPGFFTDTLGFLALLPQLRRVMLERLLTSGVMSTGGRAEGVGPQRRRTLEGEYRRED